MNVADWLITPDLIEEAIAEWWPLGLVNLANWPADHTLAPVLPFPAIGYGSALHAFVGTLDAVAESPVSVDSIARQILLNPNAAAVIVQLLRSIEGLPLEKALVLESLCFGLLQGSGEHQAWLTTQSPGAPMPSADLIIERADHELSVTLDRPWALNAIDRQARDQLYEAFTLALLDPDILTVSLRGNGPAFSVGADLSEFGTTRDPATAHLIRARTLPANLLARISHKFECHIHGGCVGSALEMAAFAHRITATSDAWFQLPELAMGIMPGAGGCVSIPRRIGRQRTALMILSGRRINAATALRWGLVDAIVDSPSPDNRGHNAVQ